MGFIDVDFEPGVLGLKYNLTVFPLISKYFKHKVSMKKEESNCYTKYNTLPWVSYLLYP